MTQLSWCLSVINNWNLIIWITDQHADMGEEAPIFIHIFNSLFGIWLWQIIQYKIDLYLFRVLIKSLLKSTKAIAWAYRESMYKFRNIFHNLVSEVYLQ